MTVGKPDKKLTSAQGRCSNCLQRGHSALQCRNHKKIIKWPSFVKSRGQKSYFKAKKAGDSSKGTKRTASKNKESTNKKKSKKTKYSNKSDRHSDSSSSSSSSSDDSDSDSSSSVDVEGFFTSSDEGSPSLCF